MDLKQFGNVPVRVDVLTSTMEEYHAPIKKLMLMEQAGELIRLKRGLYVVSPEISGKKISLGLIANHLYTHSYVSMQTALREYGLIPERVMTVKSMTMGRSKVYETPLGSFVYQQCNVDYFRIGVTMRMEAGVSYLIATPEKALCDWVVTTAQLNLRSVKQTKDFLEEDIRLDMDALKQMNPGVFRQCAEAGKKKTSLLYIAKLIEYENNI